MYQLTISFETKEQLISYLQGETQTDAKVEVKASPKKKTTKAPTEAVVEEMPISSPATVQAKSEPAPASVAVNREAIIDNVKKVTADLKSVCSVSDGVIQNIFSEIHVALGTTGRKVSELDDYNLVAFHKAYYEKANKFFEAAKTAPAPAAEASSFI